MGLFSLMMLAMGVLQLRGWDFDLDSKSGKFSIKRYGEGE